MKKGLLITAFGLLINSGFAAEFMEFGAKDFLQEDYKTSNWLFEMGYSSLPYEVVMPVYDGSYDKVKAKEDLSLSGLNLGFGGQIYFGAGFSSTIKIVGTHYRAFEDVTAKAAEDIDLDLVKLDFTHEVTTAEASGSLDYLIETSYFGVQPFVAFAVGVGESKTERDYDYDGLSGGDNPNPEIYDVTSKEKFNYNKITLGLNFISKIGITSFFSVSQYSMVKTDREIKGKFTTQAQQTPQRVDSESEDLNEDSSMTVASVGFGYLF
jgi:hypothetical protein